MHKCALDIMINLLDGEILRIVMLSMRIPTIEHRTAFGSKSACMYTFAGSLKMGAGLFLGYA